MIEAMLNSAGEDIMFDYSEYTRIVEGSGVLNPPAGARFMRVAAIGAGGGGYASRSTTSSRNAMGGTGGGCAATKIVPAQPITYSIGLRGESTQGLNPAAGQTDGGDTTASFGSYHLVGKGGKAGLRIQSGDQNPTISGPYGEGGDFNFKGGDATGLRGVNDNVRSSGGGAAGPRGNGGNGQINASGGVVNDGEISPEGWGLGGGAAGYATVSSSTIQSGSGTGAGATTGITQRAKGGNPFGTETGEMGGGATAVSTTNNTTLIAPAGNGGLVVEWFF